MYIYKTIVEFDDIDNYGIIHHPRVLHYFERARVHFLTDNGIDMKTLNTGLVIRTVNLKYKIQLTMLDKIDIEVTAKNLGKYKFDWEFKIKKTSPGPGQGKVAVFGEIETACVDLTTKKLTPVPDGFLNILSQILINQDQDH